MNTSSDALAVHVCLALCLFGAAACSLEDKGDLSIECPALDHYKLLEISGDDTRMVEGDVRIRAWDTQSTAGSGWGVYADEYDFSNEWNFAIQKLGATPPSEYGMNSDSLEIVGMLRFQPKQGGVLAQTPFGEAFYEIESWRVEYDPPRDSVYVGKFDVRLRFYSGDEVPYLRSVNRLVGCFRAQDQGAF